MTARKAVTDETAAPEAPAWQAMPEGSAGRSVRVAGLTIALVLLAAACITAFYASLRIASIWFEPRFVPIAQLVVAGVVIAACIGVVRRLKS